jgi:hypothetical protein
MGDSAEIDAQRLFAEFYLDGKVFRGLQGWELSLFGFEETSRRWGSLCCIKKGRLQGP